MSQLLVLSVSGSVVSCLVLLVDRLFRSSTTTRVRRIWWLMAVLAFLIRVPLPILPAISLPDTPSAVTIHSAGTYEAIAFSTDEGTASNFKWASIVAATWLIGVISYCALVLNRTIQTHRFWSHQRLCTDSKLLQILEDAKAELGVITPFGLVVTADVAAPAILGWVRPRILLPTQLCEALQPRELLLVLKHELAHFRAGDLLWNSLFFVVTALHWFNPLAHVMQWRWREFIEESADETTLNNLQDGQATPAYGEVLLKAIRQVNGPTPSGALAIGETLQQLKTRILMIKKHSFKRSRPILALALLVPMLAVMLPLTRAISDSTTSSDADVKKAAATATMTWLTEIDSGDYKKSWVDASTFFQKALSQDAWVSALNQVRAPLGKCLGRELVSELHQTDVPSPAGTIKGDFVIIQYDTKFENMAYTIETVTFQNDAGTWKASGYYIKPK